MSKYELIDTWKVANTSERHLTEYWMFKNKETNKVSCVSRCTHKDKSISYLMSDEETSEKFYGTEKEIKKIIRELTKKI